MMETEKPININLTKMILGWDMDYWQQYKYSYEEQTVQGCDESFSIFKRDYDEVLKEIEKVEQEIEEFLTEYGHEFI